MNTTNFNVRLNNEEIRQTVLTNVVKMLTERKNLNVDKLRENIDKLIRVHTDDYTYRLSLDKPIDGVTNVIIKIFPQKVSTISKTSGGVIDFLMAHKDEHKIVVVKEINPKSYPTIKKTYPRTELFLEHELMINLVDFVLIPKVELLTDEEQDNFCQIHMCKKRNIPKILNTDPISKYFNLKDGDIIRILRPSETSGYSPAYRLVIKG